MGSDRARRTYNEPPQYDRVVMQQGRVFLEADWNEQWEIHDAQARRTALDLVGPCGTPDNGYAVSFPDPPGNFDFAVCPGAMYVGGTRISIPELVRFGSQRGWTPVPAPELPKQPKTEFVYLEIHEQEVSAVEDPDLLDVALGGPDTAQRVRMVQRIRRVETSSPTCQEAFQQETGNCAANGLNLDPETMRLQSSGKLKVTFADSWQISDSNSATVQTGYVGAENQLIRVQVSAPNRLVWGFDNASFLYRADFDKDKITLKLNSQPVDVYHEPRANQAVEILQASDKLDNGAYIASLTGIVTTLSVPYNANTRSVVIDEPLPEEYYDPARNPRTFLRVWEEEIALIRNVPLDLGDTGLRITVNEQGLQIGDHWLIAVRRNTPLKVYPERYLQDYQPPDGPVRFVVPLAVIEWNSRTKVGRVREDCRKHFGSLGTVAKQQTGGCCTITVWPEDVTPDNPLQDILDTYRDGRPLTICLMPGPYSLPQPLQLRNEHSNLTLEGCHDGAILRAAQGAEHYFIDGLIVLCQADRVTLSNLHFELPQVPFVDSGGKWANLDLRELHEGGGPMLNDLRVSIGVRPLHCADLTIKNCLFQYSVDGTFKVFGAGIFAGSECSGLTVQRNRFLADGCNPFDEPFCVLAGYLLAPTTTFLRAGRERALADTPPEGALVRALLQDASFCDNTFTGLAIAALIYSKVGRIRFTGNTIRNSYAGLWLLSPGSLPFSEVVLEGLRDTDEGEVTIHRLLGRLLPRLISDPVVRIGCVLARGYPLPPTCEGISAMDVKTTPTAPTVRSEVATLVESDIKELKSWIGTALKLFGRHEAPRPAAPAALLDDSRIADSETETISSGQSRFAALNRHLGALERDVVVHERPAIHAPLLLHCVNNNMETTLTNNMETMLANVPSGIGLLVWDDARDNGSGLVMSANNLSNKAVGLPTALILWVERCAIAGNLVLNEAAERLTASLYLVTGPGELAAATSNVFRGTAILPLRNAGLPPWETLNANM